MYVAFQMRLLLRDVSRTCVVYFECMLRDVSNIAHSVQDNRIVSIICDVFVANLGPANVLQMF
jgi:hypothetical protein